MIVVRSSQHYPLAIYSLSWFILLTILLYFNLFAATVDGVTPVNLSCRSWQYWVGPNCGLDGIDCKPFESSTPTAIRCPTRCTWGTYVLSLILDRLANAKPFYPRSIVGA